jgi:superfamily II DNA/RNA helicase
MIATDVAARGLDFPNLDWVIQADAPENVAMYIHRVGRTARNNTVGRSLMLLMPQEEQGIAKDLKAGGRIIDSDGCVLMRVDACRCVFMRFHACFDSHIMIAFYWHTA